MPKKKVKLTVRLRGETVKTRENVDLSDEDYVEEEVSSRRSTRVRAREKKTHRKSTRKSKRRKVEVAPPRPLTSSEDDEYREDYIVDDEPYYDSEDSNSEDTAVAPSGTKRLTRRQIALRSDEPSEMLLLESPLLSSPAHLSEEDQIVKAEAALRRKRQLQKQNEELKSQTVRKLLSRTKTKRSTIKEQERVKAETQRMKDLKPGISYTSTPSGTFLSLTDDVQLPNFPTVPLALPVVRPCAIPSCERISRYACAASGLRVCSLECCKEAKASIT